MNQAYRDGGDGVIETIFHCVHGSAENFTQAHAVQQLQAVEFALAFARSIQAPGERAAPHGTEEAGLSL